MIDGLTRTVHSENYRKRWEEFSERAKKLDEKYPDYKVDWHLNKVEPSSVNFSFVNKENIPKEIETDYTDLFDEVFGKD